MTATHIWTKEIPLKIVCEANRSGEHWASISRRRKVQKNAAMVVPRRLPLPCTVEIVGLIYRRSLLDSDNFIGSCKGLRDGIAARLGVDDANPLVTWRYGQERAKENGVRITITSEVEG